MPPTCAPTPVVRRRQPTHGGSPALSAKLHDRAIAHEFDYATLVVCDQRIEYLRAKGSNCAVERQKQSWRVAVPESGRTRKLPTLFIIERP
jgi:hypothetical protein